jgi:hypothetical protein
MKVEDAFKAILDAAAAFPPRKTASMFKLCLSDAERRQIHF